MSIVILDNTIYCNRCSKNLHVLAHLILPTALRLVTVIVLIRDRYKLMAGQGMRFGECMPFAQGHTASKWQFGGSN